MTKDHFIKFGYVEAISLLVLIFIAMPMKYNLDIPEAVSAVGSIHGILFTMYVVFGIMIREKLKWSYLRLAIACIVASIPFGPFIFEKQLFSR